MKDEYRWYNSVLFHEREKELQNWPEEKRKLLENEKLKPFMTMFPEKNQNSRYENSHEREIDPRAAQAPEMNLRPAPVVQLGSFGPQPVGIDQINKGKQPLPNSQIQFDSQNIQNNTQNFERTGQAQFQNGSTTNQSLLDVNGNQRVLPSNAPYNQNGINTANNTQNQLRHDYYAPNAPPPPNLPPQQPQTNQKILDHAEINQAAPNYHQIGPEVNNRPGIAKIYAQTEIISSNLQDPARELPIWNENKIQQSGKFSQYGDWVLNSKINRISQYSRDILQNDRILANKESGDQEQSCKSQILFGHGVRPADVRNLLKSSIRQNLEQQIA